MLPLNTRLYHHREVTTFLNLQMVDQWINCWGTEAEVARFFWFNLHSIFCFIATSWAVLFFITPGNIGKCKGENMESWRECLASGNRKFVVKKQNITLKYGEQETEIIPNYTGVQEQTLTSAFNGVGLECMECASMNFRKINFWNFPKRKISNNLFKFCSNQSAPHCELITFVCWFVSLKKKSWEWDGTFSFQGP